MHALLPPHAAGGLDTLFDLSGIAAFITKVLGIFLLAAVLIMVKHVFKLSIGKLITGVVCFMLIGIMAGGVLQGFGVDVWGAITSSNSAPPNAK